MKIPTFTRAQDFKQSLNNESQLHAFALGAELPSIHAFINHKSKNTLATLHNQYVIEAIAQQCYERLIKMPEIRLALVCYADHIVNRGSTMLEDVRLHTQHPGLPLAKYYAVIKRTNGLLDRCDAWEKHLRLCRSLCFALHEYYQDPDCDICYSEKNIIIDKPHCRQCYSYTTINKPVLFQLNRYQYHQRPWQWENWIDR